ILNNYEEIKKLEQDNKKLKAMILKAQDSAVLKNKINDLIHLLDEKDLQFTRLQEKIRIDYGKVISILTKKLDYEREKNKRMPFFENQIEALKKENKALRMQELRTQFLLKKSFQKKLLEVNNNYKIHTEKHRLTIKEFEELKLENKKNIEIEKQRNLAIIARNKNLNEMVMKAEEDNKRLRELTIQQSRKIEDMHKFTLANKNVLNQKISEIKQEAENKVKKIAKEFLDREIEYKTRIESLNKDLGRYLHELKEVKEKYYQRELELKEKFRNILGNELR
ncbi:MAG: hypothetical protein NDI94_00425, partial [Candidatus Woesearchaeota archaeon]|nr:hypothetical protein [Candidatus Woesearchaeota archaeon]